MSTSIEELKARLEGLMHSKDGAVRKECEDWVSAFEMSTDAWVLAVQLMAGSEDADPNQLLPWWGARTIYTKLKRQYFQLDENLGAGAAASLKSTLTQHLMQQVQVSEAMSTQKDWLRYPKFLALSITTMQIQSGEDSSVKELFELFSAILPYSPRIVLEFMLILPEECDNQNIDGSSNKFDEFEKQMGLSYIDALSFLHKMWDTSDVETKVRILNAITNWTSFAPVDVEALMNCELIPISLQNLSTRDELFVASIDLWTEFLDRIRYSRAGKNFGVMDLPRVLLTVMPELQEAWKECMSHIESDDLDDTTVEICRHIATFMNEFSFVYVDVIFSEDEFHQAIILPLLLECAKFPPSSDRDIAVTVLDFFDYASDILLDPGMLKTHMVEGIRPLYTELLQTAVAQMAAVDAEEFNSEDTSKVDDIRSQHWRRTIGCCAKMIGVSNAVAVVGTIIQTEQAKAETDPDSVRWQFVESAICAAGHISNFCSGDLDATGQEVSQLLQLTLGTSKMNLLMSITINKTIGAFYPWLRGNTAFLLPSLQNLLASVSDGSSCDSASKAFEKIALKCASLMTSNVSDFITFYRTQKQTGFHSPRSETQVLSGISAVIESLTDDGQAMEALAAVLEQITQNLGAAIDSGQADGGGGDLEGRLVLEMKNLTSIAKSSIREAVYLPAFSSLLALSQRVVEKLPSQEVCDECCTFLMRSLKKSSSCFGQVSPVLAEFVTKGFQAFRLSPFLALGAGLVTSSCDEAKTEASAALHTQMIFNISTTFFGSFTSQALFEEHAAVVEEYFKLLYHGLRTFPVHIVSNAGFSHIVSTALSCLQFVEDDSQRAVFLYLQCLARLSADLQPAKELVSAIGPEVLRLGVSLLTGEIKLSAFCDIDGDEYYQDEDESDPTYFGSGSLVDLLYELRQRLPTEFQAWLHSTLSALSDIPRGQAERLQLMEVTGVSTKMIFLQRLEEFEAEVRKRA